MTTIIRIAAAADDLADAWIDVTSEVSALGWAEASDEITDLVDPERLREELHRLADAAEELARRLLEAEK